MKTEQKQIGISLGDPAGIGSEITFKALNRYSLDEIAMFHVIGTQTGFSAGREWCEQEKIEKIKKTLIEEPREGFMVGEPSLASGIAQVKTLRESIRLIKEGVLSGLVTAPIQKQSIRAAGFNFPGHTEFLAHHFGDAPVAMSFLGGTLRTALVTTHIPLTTVSNNISIERIVEVTKLAIEAIKNTYPMNTIGVLGLNPHAGEQGLFGNEETEIISPAITKLRKMCPDKSFKGPLPPDSAFRAGCDFYIAMYHDQALIPVKLLDFDKAVNVTLGLPFPRTSPDHGVAYDIAGKGIANEASMHSAIQTCIDLSISH